MRYIDITKANFYRDVYKVVGHGTIRLSGFNDFLQIDRDSSIYKLDVIFVWVYGAISYFTHFSNENISWTNGIHFQTGNSAFNRDILCDISLKIQGVKNLIIHVEPVSICPHSVIIKAMMQEISVTFKLVVLDKRKNENKRENSPQIYSN